MGSVAVDLIGDEGAVREGEREAADVVAEGFRIGITIGGEDLTEGSPEPPRRSPPDGADDGQ